MRHSINGLCCEAMTVKVTFTNKKRDLCRLMKSVYWAKLDVTDMLVVFAKCDPEQIAVRVVHLALHKIQHTFVVLR